MSKSLSAILLVVILLMSAAGLGMFSSGLQSTTESVKAYSEMPILYAADALTSTLYFPLIARHWDTNVPPFGVQFYGTLSVDRGLTEIVDAGIRWARMPLNWGAIEPENTTPDQYNWSGLDTSVIRAGEQNLELILTIAGQPSWAAEYAMGPVYDIEDIKEFVGALVSHYDGTNGVPEVQHFELYNEPDNASLERAVHGGWGYWGLNGTGYAELLRELYPVVKAANPDAQLVFGGMAMDWFIEDGGPYDSGFLEDVLAACEGQDCFDVMNFHYYPVFYANWKPYGEGIIGKSAFIRNLMQQYGFGEKLIICTEMGWDSNASWGNTELQSRYPAIVYSRAMAADLPIVIWFMLYDLEEVGEPGILDEDYQPKPSYYGYQTMTEMLASATYERTLSSADTGSDKIEGYVFSTPSGRMDVVWTVDGTQFKDEDDPVVPLSVRAESLRIVDKLGGVVLRYDAGDGADDGRITIDVMGSPQYLVYNP